MKLNMIKKLILALLLGAGIIHAGSWAEYSDYELYIEKQGVDLKEYNELIKDIFMIEDILLIQYGPYITQPDIDQHIYGYLESVGSKASLWILNTLKSLE